MNQSRGVLVSLVGKPGAESAVIRESTLLYIYLVPPQFSEFKLIRSGDNGLFIWFIQTPECCTDFVNVDNINRFLINKS